MDRETVLWQLKWVDRVIRNSELRIARLFELQAFLHRSGGDAKQVNAAIHLEERAQALRRMDRSRLVAMVSQTRRKRHWKPA